MVGRAPYLVVDRRVDPAALRPGQIYVAESSTPGYGSLLAAVALGTAVRVGDHAMLGDLEVVAVRGRAKNPEIGISATWYQRILHDYGDWRQGWWREAIQNAVDAGAKHVVCQIVEQPDRTWLVSVDDDGKGMSEEVLVEKFLQMGGTTKGEGGEGTGGFGAAKELLIMPWLRWKVAVSGLVAEGRANKYELEKGPARKGVHLEVVMPADQRTAIAPALAFIEKCNLPRVKFRCVESSLAEREFYVEPKARLVGKDLVEEIPGLARVYVAKVTSYTPHYLYIRSNGLYMFESWIGETKGKQVLCELLAPSVEVLTKNRDGFRDSSLRRAVGSLAERIAKDTQTALRSKSGLVRQKYEGAGKFYVGRREAEALQHIGPITPQQGGVVLQDSAVADVARATGLAELASVLLSSVAFTGPTHVEDAVRQLVWQPDFLLVNEIEGYRVPVRFRPESMSQIVVRLVAAWTELCRFVLMQLGSRSRFGVGLIFSDMMAAAYQPDHGEHWLLLNPFRDYTLRREIWQPTKLADRKWMYAAAIHECTHLADGIDYHDEAFAAALTKNVARTADGFRKVSAIIRATKVGVAPALRPLENPTQMAKARLLSW